MERSDREGAKATRRLRCILHIGTEKTGTSTIQHFLSRNRDAFAAEGVLYPRITGAQGGSQWGFVAAVMDRPWQSDIGVRLGIRNEAEAATYRERLVAAVDGEIADTPAVTTLLLSSEHFHSRLVQPEKIQQLKRLLKRWADDFAVIVYFRRQDRAALSRYSTRLKSGHSDPDVFPVVTGEALPYYYDYYRVFENWADAFGRPAMVPGLFERTQLDAGDLISDFCKRASLSPKDKLRPPRINVSLSDRGVELLLELNRQWPRAESQPWDLTRERLVASIARNNRGKSYPVSRADATRFCAAFRECNARLGRIAFPEPELPPFSEDFSEYPQKVCMRALDRARLEREVRKLIGRAKGVSGRRRRQDWNPESEPASTVGGWAASLVVAAVSRLRSAIRPPPTLPPLYLHVGLPKTGTTTLQNTLFSHHPDICYLGKSKLYENPKGCLNRSVYDVLTPLLWKRALFFDPRKARIRLAEALGDLGSRALVGSWEGQVIQEPRRFQRMVIQTGAVFGDTRILFTLRNPLTRVPSAYLFALKSCAKKGAHHSLPEGCVYTHFDEWLRRHRKLNGHSYLFDFADNLRFAVDHLGAERVGVFLLEELKEDPLAYFGRIAEFLGISSEPIATLEQKMLNTAISAEEVALLEQIQASPERLRNWRAASGQERLRLLDAARAAGSGESYRVRLSPEQQEIIMEHSRDVNRWLTDTFDLDLERYGYPV